MQDKSEYVRRAAAEAVGRLGAHASELLKAGLLELMQDEHKYVRRAAASSLSQTPDSFKLVCIETFPNQPLAITASQSIAIPDIGAFSEKSWHFDYQTKKTLVLNPSEVFRVVDASAKDKQKVVDLYQVHPVPGYEVGAVRVVYNPNFNRTFQGKLHNLQQRQGSKAFAPSWQNENDPQWREKTHQQLERWAASYQDTDYPNVKIVPVWHGTSKAICESIFKTGFANLATTDSGFYGKGIYGAHEAEYSYNTYAKKHGTNAALLMNWIATYSAYPVIDGDMKKFVVIDSMTKKEISTGNYGNYDAHFIPVAPHQPCKVNQDHINTEIVTFEEAACLPRYVVELQKTLLMSPKPFLPCFCKNKPTPQNQQNSSSSSTPPPVANNGSPQKDKKKSAFS